MTFVSPKFAPAVPEQVSRPAPLRRRWPVGLGHVVAFARRATLALVVPVAIVILWSLSAHFGWVSTQILPAPTVVAGTFRDMLSDGDIANNLGISLWRIAKGFAIGSAIGLSLGVAMGLSPSCDAWIGPIFRTITQIPPLAWIPLLMQLVGIDEALKLVVMIKASMIPVAITTADGIRDIPHAYLELGRVLRLPRAVLLRRIVLPGALPSIFTGLRQGLQQVWGSLVIVEMMASTEGLGYLMNWNREIFQLDGVLVCIVLFGVIGFTLDFALRRVELSCLRWKTGALA